MRQLHVWFLATLVATTSAFGVAHASGCGPQADPQGALVLSQAVFCGRVLSAREYGEHRRDPDRPREWVACLLEVLAEWKGAPADTVTIRSSSSGELGGKGLRVGETYLIYARRRNAGLGIGACDRSRPIERAAADLFLLSSPKRVRGEGAARRPTLDSLAEPLERGDRHEQFLAFRALAELGPLARPAIPALLDHAQRTDAAMVREAVCTALAIAPEDRRVLRCFDRTTHEKDVADRVRRLLRAWDSPGKSTGGSSAPQSLVRDPQHAVRLLAFLWMLSDPSASDWPTKAELVEQARADRSQYVRNHVLRAAVTLAPTEMSAPLLERWASDRTLEIRMQVALLARALGPEGRPALEVLIRQRTQPITPIAQAFLDQIAGIADSPLPRQDSP